MAGARGPRGRLLGTTTKRSKTKASQTDRDLHSSSTSDNTSPYPIRIPSPKFPFLWETKKPPHRISRSAEQRAALITLGAARITPEKKQDISLSEKVKDIDLLLPLAYEVTRRMILRQFGAVQLALASQCWSKNIERIIHQVVTNCQSFSLMSVAGSLFGSVLLFVEGCALVVKSFFTRFHAMSHTDHGETMRLLIEALDMFLIGTALLTFGMGMYTMFSGSRSDQKQEQQVDISPLLGAFHLKKLKEGAMIRTLTQAKTRIGHAIVLLLQVENLERFMSVPLVTGLDMACFGGAVFASSAGVFLLSKLNMGQQRLKDTVT